VTVVFHLRVVGALMMLLAASHLGMPRHFRWHEELAGVSLLTRQVFWVHTWFVCIVLLMMGGLSLFATESLLEHTRLGRLVLGGFAVFWLARLFCQWFVFDPSLWRGHRMNTAVHAVFTVLWSYFAAVNAVACFG
jgi:hypothetical protein